MATSSVIISLFNKARESYTPISGPTTDENMVNFREAILTILYSIYRGADAGCLSGLIFTDVEYKGSLVTTASFDPMIGAFKLYDPSIKYDATDGLRKKDGTRMDRPACHPVAHPSLQNGMPVLHPQVH